LKTTTANSTCLNNSNNGNNNEAQVEKSNFLRGALSQGSTTIVLVLDSSGNLKDLTEKTQIEQALMENNKEKYSKSFHTHMYKELLIYEFDFKGLTLQAKDALDGCDTPIEAIDPHILDFLQELKI
jgi:hypothetical protein